MIPVRLSGLVGATESCGAIESAAVLGDTTIFQVNQHGAKDGRAIVTFRRMIFLHSELLQIV